tara:strand:+ start:213 stop:1013 length:801 start_codon:yes stop_codon:yes gene_type:complete
MGAESSCDSGGGCDYGTVNSRLSELYDQVTTSSKGNLSSGDSNFVSFIDSCEKMGIDTGLSKDTSHSVVDTCMTNDDISMRLTELNKELNMETINNNSTASYINEEIIEHRLEELYSLIEKDTIEDFNVFETEISLKPYTFGILEDIIMEDKEQQELTTEEFREYLGEFSYLFEQVEKEPTQPTEVIDIEKLIEEIKSSKKNTQTGLLLGRSFELLGSRFCSKYGSVVSSICGNIGEDIGRDIGNMIDPMVQTFIKHFEKAKEEGS